VFVGRFRAIFFYPFLGFAVRQSPSIKIFKSISICGAAPPSRPPHRVTPVERLKRTIRFAPTEINLVFNLRRAAADNIIAKDWGVRPVRSRSLATAKASFAPIAAVSLLPS
jgi:hypothetical protein